MRIYFVFLIPILKSHKFVDLNVSVVFLEKCTFGYFFPPVLLRNN